MNPYVMNVEQGNASIWDSIYRRGLEQQGSIYREDAERQRLKEKVRKRE